LLKTEYKFFPFFNYFQSYKLLTLLLRIYVSSRCLLTVVIKGLSAYECLYKYVIARSYQLKGIILSFVTSLDVTKDERYND